MEDLLRVFVAAAVVFVLLLVGEYLNRRRIKTDPEIKRKFVHITVGTFVAFWPLFLSWEQIIFMSAAFLVGIIISEKFNIFKAIHTVQRPTWGELFFAAIVGLLALVTNDGWIFAAAIMHMSFADGFAAVIGTKFGKHHRYRVFGHIKSVAGTMSFFVLSCLILIGYTIGASVDIAPAMLLGIALVATTLENISIRGFDNLTVPLFVAYALTMLS